MAPRAGFHQKALATDKTLAPSSESQGRQEMSEIHLAFDSPLSGSFRSSVVSSGGRAMAYLAQLGHKAIASVRNASVQSMSGHIVTSQHGAPITLSAAEAYGIALQVRKALHDVLSERPKDKELTSIQFEVAFPAADLPRGELALFYANDRHISTVKKGQKRFKVSLLSVLVLRRLGVSHITLSQGNGV